MFGRIVVVIALVAGSLGLSVAVQQSPAQSHTTESHLSFHVTDVTVTARQRVTFFGRLSNSHARCRRHRIVRLREIDAGTIDFDRTDFDGEYFFRINPDDSGIYFVSVRTTDRFGYDDQHRCTGDSSRRVQMRPTE